MADDGKLKYEVVLDIEDMKRKIAEAEGKFDHMSRSASKAGEGLRAAWTAMGGPLLTIAGAATVMVKTIGSAVKTNMEFERKSSELAAVLGTTKDRVKALTDAAKDLGRTTEFSATQVEELQIALARLGFSNGQILAMQGSVLKFAAAVNTDLGSAADFAGSALRAFGLEATDTNRLLDIMSASTSKSALDFSKLQTSISIVAPIAHSFGLSVEDTVTFLGALSNAGFDASSAATAFRNILLNLADANGNLAKGLGHTANTFPEIIAALKECTEKGLDLASAMEMTDKRSVSAFSALISGADGAQKLRDELGNCNGAMEEMYTTMTDNLEGAVKGLSSAWEGLMLTMSKSNGPMKSAVDWIAKLVNATTDYISVSGTGNKSVGDKKGENAFFEEFKKRAEAWGPDEMLASYEQWVKDSDAAYSRAIEKYNASKSLKNKRAMNKAGRDALNISDIRQAVYDYAESLKEQSLTPLGEGGAGSGAAAKILSEEEKKAIAKAAKDLAAAQKDMWKSVNDANIAAMAEGTAKKLASIENDRLQTLDAIDKEQKAIEELAKKSGGTVSAETYSQLQQRRDYANEEAIRKRREAEAEQTQYIASLYQEMGDVFLSQEQRKIEGIRRTYDEMRKQLKASLEGGTISQSDYDKLIARAQEAEAKETGDAWVESFGTYEQKLQALRDKAAEAIKNVPAEYVEGATKQMEEVIADFIASNGKAQTAITRLFDDMSSKSVKDLRDIVEQGKKLQALLGSGAWDATLGEQLGISQEQFNTLRQSPEQLEKIAKAIREIKGRADDMDSIFNQVGQGLKDMFSSSGDMVKMQEGLGTLTAGLQKATAVVGVLQEAFQDIAEGSGNESIQRVADGLGAAIDAVGAAMNGAQAGSAFGPWGAAIGAAVGLASSLYKNISKLHDENIRKSIEGLQDQVDDLTRAYDTLSDKVSDVFGSDKARYIEEQNRNLQRQNRLIREQIAEEESKKNTDEAAVDAYQDKLRENERLIRENKEAAVDALFGSDIQNAITGFSDAVTSAWASGEKGAKSAKDYVRTMMQNMVSEAVKAYIQASGQMDRVRDYMALAMADQVISDSERKRIEDMAKDLADNVQSQFGWAEDIFSDKERSALRGSKIAASQESVDESNARLTTIQEHTYTLVQGQRELVATSSRILEKVTEIADNTEATSAGIRNINETLGKVRVAVDTMATRGVKLQ